MVNYKGPILFRVYSDSFVLEGNLCYECVCNGLYLIPCGRLFVRLIPNLDSIGGGGLTGGQNRQGGLKAPVPTRHKEWTWCSSGSPGLVFLRVPDKSKSFERVFRIFSIKNS